MKCEEATCHLNPDLVFTEAKPEHVMDMLSLYNHYIINSTATFDLNPISSDVFLHRIKLNDAHYKTYVIMLNDRMIGFCFFIPYRDNPAYERTVEIGLYIRPGFTGRKYGETVVRHLEQVIRDKGFGNIIASISSDNTPSIHLFQKLGYRQCADFLNIAYKHDHYVGIVDFQKILHQEAK